MKTAISLPDELFEEADAAAERLGVSRSELYARALAKYLEEMRDAWVTDKLNEVYTDEDSSLDPVLRHLVVTSLPDEGW